MITIGINRPEKRNCVDTYTAEKLRQAIQDFENDTSVYAGVLYGIGGNFCAGYDLNELSQLDETRVLDTLHEEGTMVLSCIYYTNLFFLYSFM